MKTLFLIRHAKAEQSPGLRDIDRPLASKGKQDAAKLAKAGVVDAIIQTQVYCSPAVRARQTIETMIKHSEHGVDFQVDDWLYTFDHRDLVSWLQQRDNSIESVTIVGHNPGIENLFMYLTGEYIDAYSTCTFSHFELDIEDWQSVRKECGVCLKLLKPKELP